jgi:hypothetical protein
MLPYLPFIFCPYNIPRIVFIYVYMHICHCKCAYICIYVCLHVEDHILYIPQQKRLDQEELWIQMFQ